jgi:hypothetical protein
MIRRERIQQLREESIALIENSVLENSDPDEPEPEWEGLVDWGLELAQQRSVPGAWRAPQDPQPPPRRPSTIATVRADWDTYVDARADARVLAQFGKGGSLGEDYREAIAEVIVIKCEQYKRALTIEIEALRRELDAARAEIKALRGDANQICSWSIDRRQYRVTPFLPGGKPGVTLDLRPLFARYREEVGD